MYKKIDVYKEQEFESSLPNEDLDLLKKARYISEKSLGTIDVFSILKSVYNDGQQKNYSIRSL